MAAGLLLPTRSSRPTAAALSNAGRHLLFSSSFSSPSPATHNSLLHSFPPSSSSPRNVRSSVFVPTSTPWTHHSRCFSTVSLSQDTPFPAAEPSSSPSHDAPDAKAAAFDPAHLYSELRATEKGGAKRSRAEWDQLGEVLRHLAKSGWATDQALAIYVPGFFFPTAAAQFRNFVFKRVGDDLFSHLLSIGPSPAADRLLFPAFVDFCLENFPEEIKKYRKLVESADLTAPHTWFPFARAMKRRIVYHCGPTNSGKTYNALQRFMEAGKAVYCSPLRLLAMEVFDKVNALGVYCSLLTGQEHKTVPFSNHTACTVEMVSTEELYDVAVIDEIQMMSDPTRGYAWTRALLGLKADEIHLCGDPSVLKIVRKICKETGDELVEHHYERFKPLVVEAKTLQGDLKNVRAGDCVVAFSRREIFEVRLAIEKFTNHRCCVIYGALPPETRRQQATLFNEQDNEYDVLVASDAVGMGLNLNIRRVVFYSLSKYNGDKIVPVPASQVKQIAGRAGRRGSRYPDGLVTTFQFDDLNYLIECLKQPFEEVTRVGLFPFFEQVELFAGQFPDVPFPQLLDKFRESCRLDGSYFLCRHDHVKKVANMLERVQDLSLEDRFNFCFAPVSIRDPKAMFHLIRFAMNYSQNRPVSISLSMPKCSARNDAELLDLETKHQVLSMYLWLSHHFKEETFPHVEKAETMATNIAELLGKSLAQACWKPESRQQRDQRGQQKEHSPEEEFDEFSNHKEGYQRPRSLVQLFRSRSSSSSRWIPVFFFFLPVDSGLLFLFLLPLSTVPHQIGIIDDFGSFHGAEIQRPSSVGFFLPLVEACSRRSHLPASSFARPIRTHLHLRLRQRPCTCVRVGQPPPHRSVPLLPRACNRPVRVHPSLHQPLAFSIAAPPPCFRDPSSAPRSPSPALPPPYPLQPHATPRHPASPSIHLASPDPPCVCPGPACASAGVGVFSHACGRLCLPSPCSARTNLASEPGLGLPATLSSPPRHSTAPASPLPSDLRRGERKREEEEGGHIVETSAARPTHWRGCRRRGTRRPTSSPPATPFSAIAAAFLSPSLASPCMRLEERGQKEEVDPFKVDRSN
ncbi:hypothetical protein Taro_029416 [Colocasia esculenta]|uniref:ATP-dependent RNA helicase SUV3L, mitochondrial n=1 Tax=Colocasia esculenta TaxID=4460 RepID=A0A843VLA9_COLES|nr:hypothetical protein [Colocasia esculenta]